MEQAKAEILKRSAAVKTIADGWRIYRAAIYKGELSGLQERELRRAFFAGASVLYELSTLRMPDDEAEALKHMQALHAEVREFSKTVARGGA